jgi:hypothetical protein
MTDECKIVYTGVKDRGRETPLGKDIFVCHVPEGSFAKKFDFALSTKEHWGQNSVCKLLVFNDDDDSFIGIHPLG